jgi:hypothetical protein
MNGRALNRGSTRRRERGAQGALPAVEESEAGAAPFAGVAVPRPPAVVTVRMSGWPSTSRLRHPRAEVPKFWAFSLYLLLALEGLEIRV